MSVAKIIAPHFEANADDEFRVPNLIDIWRHVAETKPVTFATIKQYHIVWRRHKLMGLDNVVHQYVKNPIL